jgi:hypothetical protein
MAALAFSSSVPVCYMPHDRNDSTENAGEPKFLHAETHNGVVALSLSAWRISIGSVSTPISPALLGRAPIEIRRSIVFTRFQKRIALIATIAGLFAGLATLATGINNASVFLCAAHHLAKLPNALSGCNWRGRGRG